MITVSSCVKMGRAVYIAVGPVIEPNDRFATVLTGKRDYFHGPGTAATEGQRQTTEEVTVHLPWVRQVPGGSLAVRLSGHTRRFL
jgi:hypothetical protein